MTQINDIQKKIEEYIVNNFLFGDDSLKINNSDSFMERGIIDSTGMLELITFTEEEFSIEIEDDEMIPENLDSLNNISSFVLRKKV